MQIRQTLSILLISQQILSNDAFMTHVPQRQQRSALFSNGKDNHRARVEKNLEEMMGRDWREFRATLVAQEAAEERARADRPCGHGQGDVGLAPGGFGFQRRRHEPLARRVRAILARGAWTVPALPGDFRRRGERNPAASSRWGSSDAHRPDHMDRSHCTLKVSPDSSCPAATSRVSQSISAESLFP